MAEDCINHAATLAQLPERPCETKELNIHGHHTDSGQFGHLWVHGSDAPAVQELKRSGQMPRRTALHGSRGGLGSALRNGADGGRRAGPPHSRAVSQRQAALAMAPAVADILAVELGHDDAWKMQQIRAFEETARHMS